MESLVVGVDLDNTIICYDALFHRLAVERGLVPPTFAQSKKLIRDAIRALPDGDIEWQRLQGAAYGPRIGDARLFPGVQAFFEAAVERRARTFVVSHKTERASYGDPDISLRASALEFLGAAGLVRLLVGGTDDVFFAGTRPAKCRRIRDLGCAVFVDDLLETFREPDFPTTTEALLFDPSDAYAPDVVEHRFSSWKAITDHVFA